MHHLRKKHDTLVSSTTTHAEKLSKLQGIAHTLELESQKPSEEDTPLTRKIRMLENRLDKAMIKYNEAQSIRKTYEQIVKRLKDENAKVVIQSPYYKKQEIKINKTTENTEILLQPDDYAMMLKAFMKSDIKDWETRKIQLNKILSDNLKNNIICKHFNNVRLLETNFDKLVHNNDTVFVKGSNSTGLYKFCKNLEKKYELGE